MPLDTTDFLRQCTPAEILRQDMVPAEFDIRYYFRFVDRLMLKYAPEDPRSIPKWNWETIIALFRDSV